MDGSFVQSKKRFPNFKKAYTNYGEHIQTYLNRTLFCFLDIDTNNKMACLQWHYTMITSLILVVQIHIIY